MTPLPPRRRSSCDRRVILARRCRAERRTEQRRVLEERRGLPDRRAPAEPPIEHLRNALQLLQHVAVGGRLHYDDRLDLDAATRRLNLALQQLEGGPPA
ncbi:MAG: hypothetical protein HYS40_01845 [Gemmatimonadetes bacterium]|nr:hypothetical protein [Gemmatimonadota bacterium]